MPTTQRASSETDFKKTHKKVSAPFWVPTLYFLQFYSEEPESVFLKLNESLVTHSLKLCGHGASVNKEEVCKLLEAKGNGDFRTSLPLWRRKDSPQIKRG